MVWWYHNLWWSMIVPNCCILSSKFQDLMYMIKPSWRFAAAAGSGRKVTSAVKLGIKSAIDLYCWSRYVVNSICPYRSVKGVGQNSGRVLDSVERSWAQYLYGSTRGFQSGITPASGGNERESKFIRENRSIFKFVGRKGRQYWQPNLRQRSKKWL